MYWAYSGKPAREADERFSRLADDAPAETLEGQPYLIRSGYLVPYYDPGDVDEARLKARRERLNIELCNRVFRISDARDVTRRDEQADAAITLLQQQYESLSGQNQDNQRGIGRIVFARIVARIRYLSQRYLESEKPDDLAAIDTLHRYVMEEHPELFTCVRLYDHSVDEDGIIAAAFAEIGQTQTQSLEHIYARRAASIGSAMAGIHEVESRMAQTLSELPMLPVGEIHDTLNRFAQAAARLCGFPTSDYQAYDPAAADYIDRFDAVYDAIMRIDHLNVSRGFSHQLAEWLLEGMHLIDSMQNIRAVRRKSIDAFSQRANE